MITKPLFIVSEASQRSVSISFDSQTIHVPEGISVAAALLAGGIREFRSSIVGGVPRAPYCMMGVCFECLVEIDGVPARQSCLVPVREGMEVKRQIGAPELIHSNGDHDD
ncbi:(2Fe-2S)-binding protein [Rhizobium pusense]|jgi:predicted molibdopterin-dependent oxidoreductase YjgC|uniref:(2Fe-2S)-binding protein n=1 Tax=Agrobacterium TaxID=357 RepID=UPI00092853FF|nr:MULTISPECIES: (2Fe-2S)-binding protein [Agrobacterium]MDH0912895.1 (2Fe-2S)-binding protein [Agrobacterium pusense]MDH1099144.1 (2Fe-2S)-binding protein [Agrobacterium pusense]MDH1115714.1 (2Fe-2S)-binding protein [Agrobacterium pusense]MDH2197264.1 (2Fe-2S)-binding protein [Agrobacterium pusense]OJH55644.1 NAD(FAD)-dependent dehydrogenase [Agrobacterium pusense]